MNPMTNMKNVKKLSEQELKRNFKTSWHDQYKDSAWIFVGGLPYDLTEGDLICVFSQYGEVVNINLARNRDTGKQKGYCFICYEDQRSTVLAVDNLNGIKILGRTIRVDHVKDYKMPKDHKNTDSETRKLQNEGCAPSVKTPQMPIPSTELPKFAKEEEAPPDGFRLPPRLPIGSVKIKKEESASSKEDKPKLPKKSNKKKTKKVKKKHHKKRDSSSDSSSSSSSSSSNSSSSSTSSSSSSSSSDTTSSSESEKNSSDSEDNTKQSKLKKANNKTLKTKKYIYPDKDDEIKPERRSEEKNKLEPHNRFQNYENYRDDRRNFDYKNDNYRQNRRNNDNFDDRRFDRRDDFRNNWNNNNRNRRFNNTNYRFKNFKEIYDNKRRFNNSNNSNSNNNNRDRRYFENDDRRKRFNDRRDFGDRDDFKRYRR